MDRNRIARVKILNAQRASSDAATEDDPARADDNGAQADTSRAS
jgi:hypothetical protein